MKTIQQVFFATIILLAAIATAKYRVGVKQADRVMVSQNPVPACPPFCDPDPNTGPDTKTAKR